MAVDLLQRSSGERAVKELRELEMEHFALGSCVALPAYEEPPANFALLCGGGYEHPVNPFRDGVKDGGVSQ